MDNATFQATIDECVVRMDEKTFQKAIKNFAQDLGYLHYHTHDPRGSEPGYPDSTISKGGRLIYAELKSAKGSLSNDQREWINALINVQGVECYVWKPKDWQDIIRVLAMDDRNNKTRIVSPILPPKKRMRK